MGRRGRRRQLEAEMAEALAHFERRPSWRGRLLRWLARRAAR